MGKKRFSVVNPNMKKKIHTFFGRKKERLGQVIVFEKNNNTVPYLCKPLGCVYPLAARPDASRREINVKIKKNINIISRAITRRPPNTGSDADDDRTTRSTVRIRVPQTADVTRTSVLFTVGSSAPSLKTRPFVVRRRDCGWAERGLPRRKYAFLC